MLTRRENLLIRPWQERRYINHRYKVETALPAIDVQPPAPRRHVVCKLKKRQKEIERCDRIHQDNFTLIQHLSSIMKTNRVDNYWIEAPPTFLHRVGIYHVGESKEPEKELVDLPTDIHLRKERCLGCNPQLITNKVQIPEERVPWEAPRRRISRRSSSFMEEQDFIETKMFNKKSLNGSLSKVNTTPKSSSSTSGPKFPLVNTHSLSLKHGALQLVVNFPPQTSVKLRTGRTERLLQSDYCSCCRSEEKTPVSE